MASFDRRQMSMKKRSSLRIAALSAASDDHTDSNVEISHDTVAASAKDLISNFNNIIQEHTRAASALSRNSKVASGNAKALEIAQLVKERKKNNVGKSRLESINEGAVSKFPEVHLKKVEVGDKPKEKKESKIEAVRLQHIVRNASSNIEYTDFMVEDDDFAVDSIEGELRPSSMAYLRSISTANTLQFLQDNEGLSSQEIVQKILKDGFGESNDSEPGTPLPPSASAKATAVAADAAEEKKEAAPDVAAAADSADSAAAASTEIDAPVEANEG